MTIPTDAAPAKSILTPLAASELRPPCPPILAFETTDALAALEGPIGHARAREALRVGLGIRRDGYNMFVVGSPGVGKHTVIIDTLNERARVSPIPPDWCYVHNFEESHKPKALRLPAGEGTKLKSAMHRFIEDLRAVLPVVFASDAYTTRVHAINEAMEKVHDQALDAVKEKAGQRGLAFVKTDEGFTFLPTKDGEVLVPDTFEKLSPEEREPFEEALEETEDELQAVFGGVPRWRKETRDRLKALEKEVVEAEVARLMEPLRATCVDFPEVLAYLADVCKDIPDQVHLFREDLPTEDIEDEDEAEAIGRAKSAVRKTEIRRYQVNVLVDHGKSHGAPVIYEDIPAFANLIGRIEHLSEFGALITDHTLIKPGALHLANGGYLVLDAWRLVNAQFAWTALKRALRSRLVKMDGPGEQTHPMTTITLTPDPIPLDLKVVLMGPPELYYELSNQDPELERHFKILASFDEKLPRTPEAVTLFARLIATKLRQNGLRPFHADAVAAVIEESSRLIEDNTYISSNLARLFNLLDEADYWAHEAGASLVLRTHVDQALAAFERRNAEPKDELAESIARGAILVETSGAVQGQVNALAVVQLGSFEFGRAARVSATARIGQGEVIDIEREADLSGSLHSKGILILHALLGSRFARDFPLELAASLTFEQSYGHIDGDSASLAEYCALVSAIAEVPIRQSLALTGSINSRGEVQAIGGVNAKIEGFFELCQSRGLGLNAGPDVPGVIIPVSNVQNLMLRADVVAAATEGRFRVFAVRHVDEALELLTGLPCGARDPSGAFAVGTINHWVELRLRGFFEQRRRLNADTKAPGL